MKQVNLDHLRNSGGSSITTARGTITTVREDYTSPYFNHNNNSFETSIVLNLIDAFGSLYKWEGLPEGIRSNDLETMLLLSGRLAFVKVFNEYYIVRISMRDWDQNNNLISGRIVEPRIKELNGVSIDNLKHVEIKNDRSGRSIAGKVLPYIEALGEIERKMVVNSRLVGKRLIEVQEELLDMNIDEVNEAGDVSTALQNDFNKFMESEGVFKIIPTSENGTLSPIDLQYNDVSDSLIRAASYQWNKILAGLGIPTNNLENKSERVVAGEIEIQNLLEGAIVQTMLDYRKAAAEEINSMFGFNISVDFNPMLKSVEDNRVDDGDEEPVEGSNGGEDV